MMRRLGPFYFVMRTSLQMNYRCVLVRAFGREADRLRAEAYRISRDAKVDWRAERRELGTAFCFETADARTSFSGICAQEGFDYTIED